MGKVKLNILANFGARAWSVIVSLALVPLYIRFMGIEAYGLIGVSATLQALLSVLDLGLGATMNREMARHSVWPHQAQTMRDLARTLEAAYWAVGAMIGIGLLMMSPIIANKWVNPERLSSATVHQAVMLMGLVIAFQWPGSLYAGGLRGLQHQVLLNAVNVAIATLRGIGAILVLWLLSPTIQAFFTWQLLASTVQTLSLGFCFWATLPRTGQRARFRTPLLRRVGPFAVSMSAISLVILILGQLDKVMLSRMLPLGMFGYYALAGTVSNSIPALMAPITEALLPRLSQLAALDDEAQERRLFHMTCQLTAAIIFPVASTLFFFSREILLLWTGDLAVASGVYSVVSLLSLGVAVHYSVMGTLDVLQMAHGWLKPSLYSRFTALLVLGPFMAYMALKYSLEGAATAWLVIYAGYALVTPHLVFGRLLKGEKGHWYINDVGLPLVAAFASTLLWRTLTAAPIGKLAALMYLSAVLLSSLLVVALSTEHTRQLLKSMAFRVARLPHTARI